MKLKTNTSMLLFKGCPRCSGDLEGDWEDDFVCVRCGFLAYRTEEEGCGILSGPVTTPRTAVVVSPLETGRVPELDPASIYPRHSQAKELATMSTLLLGGGAVSRENPCR